jgi:hypothetical protein
MKKNKKIKRKEEEEEEGRLILRIVRNTILV